MVSLDLKWSSGQCMVMGKVESSTKAKGEDMPSLCASSTYEGKE